MQFSLKQNVPDRNKAIERFKKLLEEECTIELKKVLGKRTLSQNDWIHVLITLYAIEYGYTMDESKNLLKSECPFMSYKKVRTDLEGELVFLKQTSKLDKKECSEFIEWIYDYAGKNGCHLPTVEEYVENKSEYQKLIRSCKNYL